MNWLNQNWLSEREMAELTEIERGLGMCGVWEKPDDAITSDDTITMDNPCFEEDEDLPF